MTSIVDIEDAWNAGRRAEALEIAKRLASDPDEVCRLDVAEVLERCAQARSRVPEAESAARLAAEIRRSLWGPDHPHGAYANATLVQWYRGVHRVDDAVRELEASLALAKRRRETDSRPVRDLLVMLADTHRDAGRMQLAAELYRQAVAEEMARSHPDTAEIRYIWNETAALYETAGDLDGAIEAMNARIAASKTLKEVPSLDDLNDLQRLGDLLKRRGRTTEARAVFERALALAGRYFPEDVLLRGRLQRLIEDVG